MQKKDLKEIISLQFGFDFKEFKDTNPLSVCIFPASIVRVLGILRNNPDLFFSQLIDINCTDYLKKHNYFELTYHLLSMKHNYRIMVKTQINESFIMPSIIDVFPNANWYEREIWDMFGIPFENHPDLRRILCDYDFSGHALRKDFPLSGYTEVFFNEKDHKVEYKKLELSQPFRHFDFLSPWEGNWQELLKQEEKIHNE